MASRDLPVPDTPIELHNAWPQGVSVAAVFGVLVGWLPIIVAIIPAVYYCILIWESKTVQSWLKRRRLYKAARRRARAKARALLQRARDRED